MSAPTLKRIEPGWLAKAIADAEIYYAANKEWCDAVRANWFDPDATAGRQALQEGGGE